MNAQHIPLTGNPFVDTGLAVIAALGGLDDIGQLTSITVRNVFKNGDDLARWNSNLKSFSQVFGTNNPLLQNAYGYKKSNGPSPVNYAIYQQTLKNFLEQIEVQSGEAFCEACGRLTDFDFSKACTLAIEVNGQKAPETKWIGRDWFPLAGSLGSDAQALPAASRSPRVCALCLFAVHYLPLGVSLVDGRLAIFQSTSADFWYELLLNTVREIQGRIGLGFYETLGAKEGSRALAKRLLALMEHLQNETHYERIPPGTALYVWRFSNAGASPDCSLDEVPNQALMFLWKAVEQGFRSEIEKFIEAERKPEYSLLRCVSERRDYPALYPKGKFAGASPELFSLYQTEIRGRTDRTLFIAQQLAQQANQDWTVKDMKGFQREEAIFEESFQNRFRQLMVRMCEQNEFTWGDYVMLFPLGDADSGIQVSPDGWKLIRYFLFHPDFCAGTVQTGGFSQIPSYDLRQKLLWYCAGCIFTDSRRKLQSDVLIRSGRGAAWLQLQFVRLAETRRCFTFSTWNRLCKRAGGHTAVAEVLFQMRLLWTEWNNKSIEPSAASVVCDEDTGLPMNIENYLKALVIRYVEDRGITRLHRDILLRFRRKELGLSWFKSKLFTRQDMPADEKPFLREEQWDEFLTDDEGRRNAAERLFQMHLMIANSYRSLTQIEAEVDK